MTGGRLSLGETSKYEGRKKDSESAMIITHNITGADNTRVAAKSGKDELPMWAKE
jgi:hypothetical protein